jgi:putative flippase GtrA
VKLSIRWVRFSVVGIAGMAVQMAVVTLLLRGLGWHYLPATTLAVEAAVLHNFWWHHAWTWRDRRAMTSAHTARRLVAFHMVNGAMSLVGNLVLVALLVRALAIDPLLGNLMAVAACALVTFTACERRIFAGTAAAALLVLGTGPAIAGAEPRDAREPDVAPAARLHPETEEAWRVYTRQVAARHDEASAAGAPFFALDAYGTGRWRDTAITGQVPAHEFDRPRPGGADVPVPHGTIHHWTGAIFLPGATLPDVLARVKALAGDEARYSDDVLESTLLERGDDRARVFMKLRRTKIVTVTYNTEHAVEYRQLGPRRATVQSASTRIAELADAGTARERELPPGDDHGYLWRLNAYWRYEAIESGVLVECESVSLSRGVPALLKPFISGIVRGLARESLERTLDGLRRALTAPAS